jgi:hypothetical protein
VQDPAEEINIYPNDTLLSKEIMGLERYPRLEFRRYGGDGLGGDHAWKFLDDEFWFGELGGNCN